MKKPRKIGLTLKERLEYNSEINKETGCWEWQLHISKDKGCGQINYEGKYLSVPRAAYQEFKNKVLKKGDYVYHKCSNSKCINPNHLSLKRAEKY